MYYYIPYYIVCKRSEKEGPFATCIPSYSNPVLLHSFVAAFLESRKCVFCSHALSARASIKLAHLWSLAMYEKDVRRRMNM